MEKTLLCIISTSHFATINLSHNEDNVLLAIIIESGLKKRQDYLTGFVNYLKVRDVYRMYTNSLAYSYFCEYITGWVIDSSIKLKMEENTNKDLKEKNHTNRDENYGYLHTLAYYC